MAISRTGSAFTNPAACSAANSGSGSHPRQQLLDTIALMTAGERVSTAMCGGSTPRRLVKSLNCRRGTAPAGGITQGSAATSWIDSSPRPCSG